MTHISFSCKRQLAATEQRTVMMDSAAVMRGPFIAHVAQQPCSGVQEQGVRDAASAASAATCSAAEAPAGSTRAVHKQPAYGQLLGLPVQGVRSCQGVLLGGVDDALHSYEWHSMCLLT
jgi:hypothetical protein